VWVPEFRAALAKGNEAQQGDYQKDVADKHAKSKSSADTGRYAEAAEEHPSADEVERRNPSEYRKGEIEGAKEKLDKSLEEVKELTVTESSFFEYINSFYNNYSEYLETLTPDKIVCVFNIIIGSLTFSSFLSVLSILLSEKIINRIKILERFPRILAILKLRNNINKKIAKVYLLIHIILILGGILCNIYMLLL
jgi:hypothetical protein